MIKKIGITGAAAAALLMGGFSATPAVASPLGVGSCVTGYICVYADASYMGDIRQWTPYYIYNNSPLHCLDFPLDFNNKTSSIITPDGSNYTIFATASGCSPAYTRYEVYAPAGHQGRVSNLAGTGVNDTFKSVQYNNGIGI